MSNKMIDWKGEGMSDRKDLWDGVIVCRCEGVRWGDIRKTLVNEAVSSSKELKLKTRVGMGICQGKVCRPLIATLTAHLVVGDSQTASTLTQNMPIRPLSLEALAQDGEEVVEDEVGRGHRDANCK